MQLTLTDNHAVAQAVHDVGSALWFGGTVMGVAGVNKSGSDLAQGIDRIRVAESAWRRFGPVQWAGIGATLLAGLYLARTGGRRLALQKGFASVGMAKAGTAVLGAAATGYAAYCGTRIGQLAEEARQRGSQVDVKDATLPTTGTPEEIAVWQRRQRVAQYVVPALAGANIVLGSYLVQSYRSVATARGVLRRLLPG
ncbi:hypothetical protein CA850_14530 [Micromonospora echinospora]|uniref:Uncharacterized protein n=1 Tax=Micromonospora echinospora TaxID=1877 RepID=A0A1C4Z9G6_MICEC|nr:hypothetical protein [Micromonospora echinospora]OZV80561.1 hypothetical protein CA850_14530 [Micromonospora echinospora]SCF29584.1 hypothetical protein GA0070618_4948 [Micromonospora echinospora]